MATARDVLKELNKLRTRLMPSNQARMTYSLNEWEICYHELEPGKGWGYIIINMNDVTVIHTGRCTEPTVKQAEKVLKRYAQNPLRTVQATTTSKRTNQDQQSNT